MVKVSWANRVADHSLPLVSRMIIPRVVLINFTAQSHVYHATQFLKVLFHKCAQQNDSLPITSNSFHSAIFSKNVRADPEFISVLKDKGTFQFTLSSFSGRKPKISPGGQAKSNTPPSKSCSVFGFHLKQVTEHANV